ncbi:DUF1542 domain-containing protein [Staphylococcus haemolyticus]|uniref:DUF1542 domain-containing protein n=1 Tax=Staphylococcus haemolyticus TaxID=1283 RepID=UPI0034DCCB80
MLRKTKHNAVAKAKVDEAVTNKNAIDQATNNNGVDTAKSNGLDAINNIQPTVVKKDEAKAAIDKAAEAKKAEIDQTPNATDEEKRQQQKRKSMSSSKNAIDQATNNNGVEECDRQQATNNESRNVDTDENKAVVRQI